MSSYLANPVIQSLLYVPPILALSSVLFLRRREYGAYGLMIFLIFLSKANNPPLGTPFVWLITNIPLLRVFYNGASFSPGLICLYCIFIPITLARVNGRLLCMIGKRVELPMGFFRRATLSIALPAFIVVILLISVFPMLSPMLTQGSPTTPLVSSLPSYYTAASDFIQSTGRYDAVMVFPAVNNFNSNQVNNITWYNGVDTYPLTIQNPSVSGVFPLNFVEGRGDAVDVLNSIYSIDNLSYLSENGYSSVPSYSANGTRIVWSPYLSSDQAVSMQGSNDTLFLANSSYYNAGGHWLIGQLSTKLNLANTTYAIVQYDLGNAYLSNIQLGVFQENGAGRWYTLSDFPHFVSNGFNTTAISLANPTVQGGAGLTNVSALVLNYEPPSQSAGVARITLHRLSFYSGQRTDGILASDLNLLGVKYAYVDTSITSSPNPGHLGQYYNDLFAGSLYFTRVFQQGTVTIYRNDLYERLFSGTTSLETYSDFSELYSQLYYNVTSSSEAFVLTGTYDGPSLVSSPNVITLTPSMSDLTDYVVGVNATAPFILNFKIGFNANWVAKGNDGTLLRHYELNGFSNGWLVPSNTTSINITYLPQSAYGLYEPILISIPFFMGVAFVVLKPREKRKSRLATAEDRS